MHNTSLNSSTQHKICVNVQDYVIAAASAVSVQCRSAINLTYALVLLHSRASSPLRLEAVRLTYDSEFWPFGWRVLPATNVYQPLKTETVNTNTHGELRTG